jgi:hypothetical protein
MYTGCVCDQLSWQMARSGLLTATARLVAQGESVAAATAAGTPTSLALQRFGHFNGAITRNGSPLGNVISAEVTYSNGLDRIETIRSDGRIEGADPGMAALTGRVEVRFADTALITQAIDGTPCELVFAWAYRIVVWCCLWPKSFPMVSSVSPLETKTDANEWRRSWLSTLKILTTH